MEPQGSLSTGRSLPGMLTIFSRLTSPVGKKERFILRLALQKNVSAIFVQQTGAIYQSSVDEYFGEMGWSVYHSGKADGSGGVLTLVRSTLAAKYMFSPSIICSGALLALTSARGPRFSLINCYFSSYGRQFRVPQYESLRQWLTQPGRGSIIMGGDFQRCEGPYSRWTVASPTQEAGVTNKKTLG